MTPLHYAAKFKHDRATEFLLFCGADFKLKNKVIFLHIRLQMMDGRVV